MNLRGWFPHWVLLVAAGLGASSCSLDKPIQSPKGKNADELYKQGTSQLEQKNYRQAIETFYKLKYDFPSEAAAVMADLKIADAHYSNKEYAEAVEGYEEVRKMHPASPYIPYVVYMLGMCHYHKSLSVDRDQSETEKALAEFHYLLTNFPDTPYAYDAYQKAQECMKKLSDHEVYVGNFYFRMNKYQAAIQRYEAALSKYPNVPLDEEVLFQLAEAYQLTKQPEKAVRTLQVLSQQYPKGKYAQKAQKLLEGELAQVASATKQEPGSAQVSAPEGLREASGKISETPGGVKVALAGSAPKGDSKVGQSEEPSANEKPGKQPQEKTRQEEPKAQDSAPEPLSFAQDSVQHESESKSSQVSQGEPAPAVAGEGQEESGLPSTPQDVSSGQAQVMVAAGPKLSEGHRGPDSQPLSSQAFPQPEKKEEPNPPSLEVSAQSPEPEKWNQEGLSSQTQASSLKEAQSRGEQKAEEKLSSGGSSKTSLRSKGSQGKEEPVGFGELRSDKPINITADRMDAFQRENRVIFEGNVVAQQEETYLYARRIVADMAPQDQGGGIRKVVAQDNVRITQNDRVATCDRAEFDHLRRTIELHGNPKIWQGKDWIDGEKVLVQLDQEKMTVVGSQEKRVSAVLHPKSQKTEKEEGEGLQEPKTRPGLSAPFAQVASQKPETPRASAEKTGSAPSTQAAAPASREEPGRASPKQDTPPAREAAPPQAAALSAPSLRAEEEAARIAASRAADLKTTKKEIPGAKTSAPEGQGSGAPRESAASFVERWARAWQSRDIDAYMAFYSKKFRSGAMDWNAWRAYKAGTFKKARSIQVSTESLESRKVGARLRVSFLQNYRADHHQDKGKKELELINEDGQWKIIAETWQPLKS